MLPRLSFVDVCALLMASAAHAAAQSPVVTKVDPPNWWTGQSINPVRVLVHGTNLAGARAECGRLRCGPVSTNARGTYAFVNVTIPTGAKAGIVPLTLRTANGAAQFDFRVDTPLPRPNRFQGVGANDVIYLVTPDRFADGDPANNDPAKSKGLYDRNNPRAYHGGDIDGIRQKLPYLKDLGVTAIWFTPVFDNTDVADSASFKTGEPFHTAYHGDHARDFYGVEKRFGDMAALRRLVDKAHAIGLKIIMDQVENHAGPFHAWVDDSPTPTWLNGTKADHLPNNWQVWTLADRAASPAVRDSTLKGWLTGILPDLNQDDPELARYLIQNTVWWAGMTGIDGIRQDTWPYAPRTLWKPWMAAIKREYPMLRVVGESWDGDPALLAFFEGGVTQWDGLDTGVDHLFDFPLAFSTRRAFASDGPLREVAMMLARDRLYGRPASLVTFRSNHDIARFMREPGATIDRLLLAFTFQLTARGIPMLYCGDEIGLAGGNDPDNRRDFPGGFPGDARSAFELAGRTPDEQRVFGHVQSLLRLRAARAEPRTAPAEHLVVDPQLFVYRRGRTVVVLNIGATPATVRPPADVRNAAVIGGYGAPESGTLSVPAKTGCVYQDLLGLPACGRRIPDDARERACDLVRDTAARAFLPMRIFVDGTRRRGEANHHLLAPAVLAGEARTAPAFTLCAFDGHPGMGDTGTSVVVGECFDVDDATLAQLDELEDHPRWYRRTAIMLANGERVFTYLLPAHFTAGRAVIGGGDWVRWRRGA